MNTIQEKLSSKLKSNQIIFQIIFTRMGTDSKTIWEPTKGAILETTRNKAMNQLPILLV
jgi:hypothetical protein